jgi:hypothetical protein
MATLSEWGAILNLLVVPFKMHLTALFLLFVLWGAFTVFGMIQDTRKQKPRVRND